MKVIKYVGEFSGAQAASIDFPKDVPVPVQRDSVADTLLAQPDFVLAEVAAPAPTPKPSVPAETVSDKESK